MNARPFRNDPPKPHGIMSFIFPALVIYFAIIIYFVFKFIF